MAQLTGKQRAVVRMALALLWQYLKAEVAGLALGHVDEGSLREQAGVRGRDPLAELTERELLDLIEEFGARGATLPDSARIDYVLLDSDLDFREGFTFEDLLDAGGALIDSCLEPPCALFHAEGRWWSGSVEFTIAEANLDWVRDEISARLDFIEMGGVDESAARELKFLGDELAKLPEAREDEGD